VNRPAASAVAALVIALLTAACGTTPATATPPAVTASVSTAPPTLLEPSPPVATPSPATLSVDATGLGPCDVSFPLSCEYLVRLQGPNGYDHYGWFLWDFEATKPGPSTSLEGDLPTALVPGRWTLSFGLIHASDVVSYVPVVGGTPRTTELSLRDVGCTEKVDPRGAIAVKVLVKFKGAACSVTMTTALP